MKRLLMCKMCNKHKFIVLLIFGIIVGTLLLTKPYKDSITEANSIDLQEIHGVGEVLSHDILVGIENGEIKGIEDLEKVNGIGEVLSKRISKKYK